MMPAFASEPQLIDRLPPVRGRLAANAPLAARTWLRVGGPAEVLFRPADRDDLSAFLAACPHDVPITVLGAASNLLIRDGGIRGVVIRLAAFSVYSPGQDFVFAQANVLDTTISEAAREQNLSGLEFLSGIPGCLGGAVAMNAGCYGREIADVLIDADVMLRDGTVTTMTAGELGLSYRHSELPAGAIVLSARLRAEPGDPVEITRRMQEIATARADAQPARVRTGGSTFANPPAHKAWALIDQAGCRGLTRGGAQVSEKHCNFLLNTGNATAADIEELGEDVRRRVMATSNIDLRWEIRRIGEKA